MSKILSDNAPFVYSLIRFLCTGDFRKNYKKAGEVSRQPLLMLLSFIQFFDKQFINKRRVRLPLCGFHNLPNQEAFCFVLTAFEILYGLRVCIENLGNNLKQRAFVRNLDKSFFLDDLLWISAILDQFLEDLLRNFG